MISRARVTATEALNGELRSPLAGVSNLVWNRFVDALVIDDDQGPGKGRPRSHNARSYAGGIGIFGMLPKRLVELRVIKEVSIRDGKAIAVKDKRLLAFFANPIEQYRIFALSVMGYSAAFTPPLPAGMTRSGMLALHHRLGPKALVKWKQHQEPSTMALFQRANGLF